MYAYLVERLTSGCRGRIGIRNGRQVFGIIEWMGPDTDEMDGRDNDSTYHSQSVNCVER